MCVSAFVCMCVYCTCVFLVHVRVLTHTSPAILKIVCVKVLSCFFGITRSIVAGWLVAEWNTVQRVLYDGAFESGRAVETSGPSPDI